MNPITTIGTFLVSKLGKDFALTALFITNKVILFTLISAFVGIMLSFFATVYNIVDSLQLKIESLLAGNSTGGSECVLTLFSAVVDSIGIIDAWNTVGPTLLLVYFTYFNAILFSFSIKLYRFVNNSIVEFAGLLK